MAKVAFSKLKLNKETEISKVVIGDVEVEIKHYIPMADKLSLINIILEEATEYGAVNKAKADALLHAYIVILYTNINFTKKEKDSILETYDLLEKNGVIDAIVGAIPEVEYRALLEYAKDAMSDYDKYMHSFAGVADGILQTLPDKLEQINASLDSFDLSQLKVIGDVVTTIGGNPAALAESIQGQK